MSDENVRNNGSLFSCVGEQFEEVMAEKLEVIHSSSCGFELRLSI